jgi:hypothetical protein
VLPFIRNTIRRLKRRRWRRTYREGQTLSRFIAKDVRREVMVISTGKITDGFITARLRTTNVLYLSQGLVAAPPFGPPEQICIDQLWNWTGQSWGGLPDGTSLVKKPEQTPGDAK